MYSSIRVRLAIWAVILLIAFMASAVARDHGQFANQTTEMKQWFDGLRSENGPCCSDADGTALSDVDWTTEAGHYRVRIAGAWIDVPDAAVLTQPNMAGKTMVWPIYGDGSVIKIRCFIPGSMI